MKLADPIRYSTPGAPLLVASADAICHWNGGQPDGNVVVEYWGVGIDGGTATFTTAAEAARFERELRAKLKKLHPRAAPPPGYPDYAAWYVGEARVFGIERKVTTALDAVCKRIKGGASVVEFDKARRARGLFFQVEGDGSGLIAAEAGGRALVVANVTSSDTDDYAAIRHALERVDPTKLKPRGSLALAERVVVLDGGRDCTPSAFAAGIARALRTKTQAPISAPDQKPPGGACARIAAGTYKFAVAIDQRAPKLRYDALWLWLPRA